jgi:hypothetical protein
LLKSRLKSDDESYDDDDDDDDDNNNNNNNNNNAVLLIYKINSLNVKAHLTTISEFLKYL